MKLSLKIILAVAILAWMVFTDRLDFHEIWSSLSFASFLTVFFTVMLGCYFTSERQRILLAAFKSPLSFAQNTKLFLVGMFFNFVLPGGVGGDVVKAYYIHRSQNISSDGRTANENSALAVLIDRCLGLYTILIIGTVAIMAEWHMLDSTGLLFQFAILVMSLAALATIFAMILFMTDVSRIMTFVKKYLPFKSNTVIQSLPFLVETFFKNPRLAIRAVVFSFLSQLTHMFSMYLSGTAMGYTQVSLIGYLVIAALGFLLSALPLTPASVGVGQAAFLFIANSYMGEKTNLGPALITIYQFDTLLISLLGAWFYVRVKAESFSNSKIPAN